MKRFIGTPIMTLFLGWNGRKSGLTLIFIRQLFFFLFASSDVASNEYHLFFFLLFVLLYQTLKGGWGTDDVALVTKLESETRKKHEMNGRRTICFPNVAGFVFEASRSRTCGDMCHGVMMSGNESLSEDCYQEGSPPLVYRRRYRLGAKYRRQGRERKAQATVWVDMLISIYLLIGKTIRSR
ncbi:hypothetical protein GGR51DRAFT_247559 [Nemania sp. FL0031]|nr:hypothetical protein GGR51DRAFT_247559 [Nemania sp. FL0031]